MGKYINRVKNPERMKPVPREALQSKYADIVKILPKRVYHEDGSLDNVFGVFLHRPEIAKIFFPYWAQTKPLLKLTVVDQELIILRMACFYGSDYVWGHHVPGIKGAGFSDEQVAKIPLPLEKAHWDQKSSALLTAVDEVVKKGNISEENWMKITKFYTGEQILDILLVMSQYFLFCTVNNVFGVKLEGSEFPVLPDM